MADGTLDSQVGARICNGLGIMRACLETQKLEQLEARMDEIAARVARDRTNAARERTFDELAEADPIRFVHIMGACFPDMVREMIRDRLAEVGMTEDDVRELIQKLEGSDKRH
jgi:hypothetical protein